MSKGFRSQDQFICGMFSAGGCTFLVPAANPSDGLGKSIFGGRTISNNVKDSFPTPINSDGLKRFFEAMLKNNDNANTALDSLMNKFGFPADIEQDFDFICIALAKQFCLFIENAPNAIDNETDILWTEYKALVDNPARAVVIPKTLRRTADFNGIFTAVPHSKALSTANGGDLGLFHLNPTTGTFTFEALESFLVKNIVGYVHNRKTIDKFEDDDDIITLTAKALGAFQRAKELDKDWLDHELGNILIYLFLEQVLEAPKIYSKIELLASGHEQAAISGGGVHLFNAGSDLSPVHQLIFGKSNITSDITTAIDNAIAAVKDVISGIKKELLLIENPILSTGFSESIALQLANILVPKKSKSRQAENAFGVFLGYSIALPGIPNNAFAAALTAKMQTDIIAHSKYISDIISADAELNKHSFYFYFLPFNNADIEKKSVMENILRGGS